MGATIVPFHLNEVGVDPITLTTKIASDPGVLSSQSELIFLLDPSTQ